MAKTKVAEEPIELEEAQDTPVPEYVQAEMFGDRTSSNGGANILGLHGRDGGTIV
jgi:hypothetical protein